MRLRASVASRPTTLLLFVALTFALAHRASSFAQASPANAVPAKTTALIISYRARPESRARFRSLMESAMAARLEQWRSDGVFASSKMLFTSYAATDKPDMFLILGFNHFGDLKRWQGIETTMPGGLSPQELALAAPDTVSIADMVKADASAGSDAASRAGSGQYLVLEYDLLIDPEKYEKYLLGYAVPQFDAWMKAGILTSYSAYINQNPPGAPWGAMILLEYKDLPSLARRDAVKDQARATLAATNPDWKKYSEDKTAVRKEKEIIPALAIPAR